MKPAGFILQWRRLRRHLRCARLHGWQNADLPLWQWGVISSISMVMLSPGITISTPSGNWMEPRHIGGPKNKTGDDNQGKTGYDGHLPLSLRRKPEH